MTKERELAMHRAVFAAGQNRVGSINFGLLPITPAPISIEELENSEYEFNKSICERHTNGVIRSKRCSFEFAERMMLMWAAEAEAAKKREGP